MTPSSTHLVLIPSFNTGPLLVETVREACAAWAPVWVVLDGSTDGSERRLRELAGEDDRLRVLSLPRNDGKGAALLHGARAARAAGFTHALALDADGQHPASHVRAFMAASAAAPGAMVLGVPRFAADAPRLRVQGRRVSNWWARLETGGQVADSLFGFRVYPLDPLLRAMAATRWMRGFDFDPEAAVRLCWLGVPALNVPAPVRYLAREAGGVSHFRYGRDNTLLVAMHVRLMVTLIGRRLRQLARGRRQGGGGA